MGDKYYISINNLSWGNRIIKDHRPHVVIVQESGTLDLSIGETAAPIINSFFLPDVVSYSTMHALSHSGSHDGVKINLRHGYSLDFWDSDELNRELLKLMDQNKIKKSKHYSFY